MNPDGILRFEPDYIAEGLKVPEEGVRLIFKDGRNIGSILEYRFASLFDYHRFGDDGPRDLRAPSGALFEVRSVTANGGTLLPPSMYGKGRKIDMPALLARFEILNGYIFADALAFPEVPYWCVRLRSSKSGLRLRCWAVRFARLTLSFYAF